MDVIGIFFGKGRNNATITQIDDGAACALHDGEGSSIIEALTVHCVGAVPIYSLERNVFGIECCYLSPNQAKKA